MSLRGAFEKARAEKRAAFIAYITAGDRNLAATAGYVRALASAGADIIELGIPFSDPVADGPTNQAAAERALAAGTTLDGVLKLVRELRDDGVTVPIALFTYLNPVYRMGYDAFAARAEASGADGVLVVDLPPEEAEGGFLQALGKTRLQTVFLASPTTSLERLPLIDRLSSGFVYYVSRTGVTGVQSALSATLASEVGAVKDKLTKPVAVGFGIATPEHVRAVASLADGVIVGSALVKIIEKTKDAAAGAREISELVQRLVKELKTC